MVSFFYALKICLSSIKASSLPLCEGLSCTLNKSLKIPLLNFLYISKFQEDE